MKTCLHLYLLFTLVLSPFVVEISSSNDTLLNLDVLINFKNAITLDPHQSLRTWNSSTHPNPCSWFGITCVKNSSQIRSINLARQSLRGSITPKLRDLHRLRFLDLSSNYFSGSIPALNPRLSHLNLSYNALSGYLGTQFFNLTNLRYLYLRSNQLQGSVDAVTGCRLLEELNLSKNNMTGFLPSSIANLSNLRTLNLEDNSLEGALPASLGSCSKLETLKMSMSNLWGSLPPSLGNCTNLRILSFWYCNLNGTFPKELASLSQIETLNLEGNSFSGPIFDTIANFSRLSILDLNLNSFSGILPTNLGGMFPNLTQFFIMNNTFSGHIPASIGNCSNLAQIIMSWNHLSGSLPEGLYHLPKLNFLDLQYNSLSGKISSQIGNLSLLETIDLNNNQFEGSVPKEFGMLSMLQKVLLNANSFSGSIPSEFANCSQLNVVEFSNNLFTGEFPSSFGQLTSNFEKIFASNNMLSGSLPSALSNASRLYKLIMNNNSLTGEIPPSFAALHMLQELKLSHNQLSGSLPSIFGNMFQLLIVDLSFNNFSGSIQPDLANSVALQYLNLSHNNLNGQIPNSLISKLSILIDLNLSKNSISGNLDQPWDKLEALEELDLSLNDFSGEIPTSLSKIEGLVFANFSYNKLQGRIPSGGVFDRLSSESYLGNPNLCGEFCYSYSIVNNQSKCSNIVQKRCKKKHDSLKKGVKIAVIVASGILICMCCIALICVLGIKCWKEKQAEAEESGDVSALFLKMSIEDISQATQNFNTDNMIGSGSTGIVYKGTTKKGQTLAFKKLNLDNAATAKAFDAELQSLRMVRHRNIARILGYCSNLDARILILEFMPNGSLDALLHPVCKLSWNERLKIADGIAQGLLYLHYESSTPIIHLDLKPSNVLIDADMEAHITDFGLARILTTNTILTQNLQGTFGYFAPEYAASGEISRKCDVYSYGMMLMELVSGRRPTEEIRLTRQSLLAWIRSMFSGGKISEIMDDRLREDERQWEGNIRALINIALHCTQDNPKNRPTMQQVTAMIDSSLKPFKTFPTTDQILNNNSESYL